MKADNSSPPATTTKVKIHRNYLATLTAGLIGLISILLFTPFYPVMPGMGLDPSWVLAVNEAVAQKLAFGRDILYTAGPLSSILNLAYHPATIEQTIIGGAFLAAGHAFLAYKIAGASHWYWSLAYAAFLVFLMESRDALFLFYPVFFSFLVYRISLPSSHRNSIEITRIDHVLLMLTASSLGLLPIIKLSLLPMTLLACIVSFILLWRSGHKLISISMIALPALTMILFWAISGQDVAALPDYFINNAPIISGYTQAMSRGNYFATPMLFVLGSLIVLYFFCRQLWSQSNIEGSLLLVILMVFLFMSFKVGFVRHDVHALTASSGILMAALLLAGLRTVNHRHLRIICMISLVTWLAIHFQHSSTDFQYYKPLSNRMLSMARESSNSVDSKMSLKERYYSRLSYIRERKTIPKRQGTFDIYPHEQAALIASGNQWSPRPVFQSFSAYTPGLAMTNLRHLSGPSAPDHIVFRVTSIDGRYPSMDDGSSWPALIAAYELSETLSNWLLLKRRTGTSLEKDMSLISTSRVHLGDSVDAGIDAGTIYVKIEAKPSLLGRIASFLYKPTALFITVELSNGEERHHRFVPGEAITGFILSPYIANTSDFAEILQNSKAMTTLPAVNSFKIAERPFALGMWNPIYSIETYKLAEKKHPTRRVSK